MNTFMISMFTIMKQMYQVFPYLLIHVLNTIPLLSNLLSNVKILPDFK